MRRNTIRAGIVLAITAVGLAALIAARAPARADTLPAPHLGYGVNVRLNIDMAAGLGFEWVKLYEAEYLYPGPNDFPPEADAYHILYRVKAEGWPASIESYVAHVEQIARDGKARGVDAYEIGNEPNIKSMWGEQNVSPENYARLLCRVYPAIKAIDPGATVVSSGLAPVGRQPVIFWDTVMDDHVFVQRMFDTMRNEFPAVWPCFDALGYHPQGYPYPPEISYEELQQQHPDDNGNGFYFRSSEYYHALMDGYGIGDRQIWATEFGYLRDPVNDPWDFSRPAWSNYGWCNDSRYAPEFADNFSWMKVTEAQQADYLVRAYQYADANMPWMGVMFLYNIDWNNQGWECDHVKFFSVYKAATGKADTDPRSRVKAQAYDALAAMPKRSAYANVASLSVEPASITFLAELPAPGVQTRTVQIDNLVPGVTMTWTAQVDAAGALQPIVSPPGGVNSGTLTVQIDSTAFGLGTYTGSISITAEPTTTLGSPAAVAVNLIVVPELQRAFLPVIGKSFTAPPPPPPPSAVTTKFGLDFVSSAEAPAASVRYNHAATLKATINRWPFYWYNIEKDPIGQPGVFTWTSQDANVIADIGHGLTIDAILMGTPVQFTGGSAAANALQPQVGQGWKVESGEIGPRPNVGINGTPADVPPGLYLSVFSDGTDTPGPGKTINAANRWARYVNAAVDRYKPGGALALQQGWSSDKGITVWEVWNEPDLGFFFSGTPADFARLLKVAYLAAKHADPNAQVMFGGMAHFEKPTWLTDVLNVIATYPDREANGWFFDVVASHNYAWAWHTFYYLYGDQQTLAAFGLTGKQLWLNETGVHVCDDAPGPACYSGSTPSAYRANMQEQAHYLIQAATFSVWLNIDAMLWYQLYDDSGNGCPGFDAPGLVRNEPSAPCNAGNGTTRPSYEAYKVATQYFAGLSPYWRERRNPADVTGNQELIALQNPATGERVVVMWARDYAAETVTLTATSTSALLVYPDGTTQTIVPVNGAYSISLPAATNHNTPTTDGKAPIGGAPRILIEHDPAIVVTP